MLSTVLDVVFGLGVEYRDSSRQSSMKVLYELSMCVATNLNLKKTRQNQTKL